VFHYLTIATILRFIHKLECTYATLKTTIQYAKMIKLLVSIRTIAPALSSLVYLSIEKETSHPVYQYDAGKLSSNAYHSCLVLGNIEWTPLDSW
jgi:hypothetical protein